MLACRWLKVVHFVCVKHQFRLCITTVRFRICSSLPKTLTTSYSPFPPSPQIYAFLNLSNKQNQACVIFFVTGFFCLAQYLPVCSYHSSTSFNQYFHFSIMYMDIHILFFHLLMNVCIVSTFVLLCILFLNIYVQFVVWTQVLCLCSVF